MVWEAGESEKIPAAAAAEQQPEEKSQVESANESSSSSSSSSSTDKTVVWAVSVVATGFLHHMMRRIVGTLRDISDGKREPEGGKFSRLVFFFSFHFFFTIRVSLLVVLSRVGCL